MRKIISNCIIIGSQKAGTTSLFYYLACQDGVFVPKIKETDFYTQYANPRLQENIKYKGKRKSGSTIKAYEKLYRKAYGSRVRIDASPSYMWSQGVSDAILALADNPLVIAIIREPLSRIKSAFIHNIRRGLEDIPDINDALMAEDERYKSGEYMLSHLYRRRSEYLSQLKPFYEKFPPGRVKVYTFEQLVESPMDIVADILDSYGMEITNTKCFKEARNTASGKVGFKHRIRSLFSFYERRKLTQINSKLNPEMKDYVIDYTFPHYDNLSKLTGCDLSRWQSLKRD